MEFRARTDIGCKYEHNEDSYALPVRDEKFGIEPCANRLGSLFILCDGMGGASAGEVASELAAKWLMRDFYRLEEPPVDPLKALGELLHNVNRRVFELSKTHELYSGMGTTVVAALFHGRALHAVSAGDSRIYRFRRLKLEQLTEDHSEVWPLFKDGILTKEEIRTHRKSNIITEALGISYDLNTFEDSFELEKRDLYLLCSDGLSDLVPDSGIERILGENSDIKRAADALVSAANSAGGKDNITVILVKV